MRSQHENFTAGSIASDNNNNYNNNYIPYHARENSLPFSYGQIKANRHLNESGGNKSRLDDIFDKCDYNSNKNTNTNSFSYKTNGLNETIANDMIKPPVRLTSPLLVRKTLNKPTTNTISNTYTYNYNNNNLKEKNLFDDDDDHDVSGLKHDVPYVTLNGTLDKNYYNNNYKNNNNNGYHNKSSSTPRNYEEFEELLRERREKVYNEHKSSSKYLTSLQQLPINMNSKITRKYSNQNNNNNNNNYDFEFNLLNLNDKKYNNDDDDSGGGMPPTPPRRHYTLERVGPAQLSLNYNVERNYHTYHHNNNNDKMAINAESREYIERPPLELNVGYKRHFDILQKQRQQWPGYNGNHKHNNNHSSSNIVVTTYGNGNVTGYNDDNNNNCSNSNGNIVRNDYFGKIHSWQQADIRGNFDTSPIYATSMKTKTGKKNVYHEIDFYRPETPAFPVTPRTPSLAPTLQREISNNNNNNNNNTDTLYQGLARSRINTTTIPPRSISQMGETQEVAAHLVKFAKDSSQYWYKANLSREEAISLLLNAIPGTFIVRDSTTYKHAYGLVLRVAQTPPGATATGKLDDLVRHFLIEPTTRGVRLKGCANEPVFTSLSALVYEHSINQLALPCLLRIPEADLLPPRTEPTPAQRQLLTQGAACNILWLYSAETESLTGEEAIRKAIRQMYAQKPLSTPTEVHFKVSQHGITLTDNTRKRFFRKHYAPDIISYCAIDPDHRLWTMQDDSQLKKTIFAFVARRSPSSKDNQCHIFCDLAINQPASAIVSFVNKTLPTEQQRNIML